MSKLKKLEAMKTKYAKELELYTNACMGINNSEALTFVEAIIYEVLNIIQPETNGNSKV